MTKSIKTKKTLAFTPDFAVAPGQTLSEVIESLNINQKQLAQRTGLTEQTIVRIMKAEQPISIETASRLEMVTGVPANMWNNLEMQYREQINKIKQRENLERDVEWLKEIPVRELQWRGVIPDTSDQVELLRETLKFYGVASVDAWRDVWTNPQVAARRSVCFDTDLGAASAWLRLGELQARQIDCEPYSKQNFTATLKAIRELTILDPAESMPRLRQLCAQAGVALALVPEISKAPWNGATKWLAPTKPMILLSLRGKGEDIFWFSFFHEAYHVLQGKKQQLYVAEQNGANMEEHEADAFAADFLIPAQHNQRIKESYSAAELQSIAKQLNISPGIVAGRFRHLTKKWSLFSQLIRPIKGEEKHINVQNMMMKSDI